MEPEHALTAPARSGAGIKLLLTSLLGIAIFFVPFELAGRSTILVDHLAGFLMAQRPLALGLILLLSLCVVAWQVNRLIQRSLLRRFQNQALIESLEHARESAEGLNQELAREVEQRRRAERTRGDSPSTSPVESVSAISEGATSVSPSRATVKLSRSPAVSTRARRPSGLFTS